VAEGRFREDLFFRLRVAPVVLAPLRQRPGDILLLARHFLTKYAERLASSGAELSPDAIERLLAHTWPGNIRELENAIHHALLLSPDGMVRANALQLTTGLQRAAPPEATPSGLEAALLALLEEDRPNLYEHIEAAVFRTVRVQRA
jgi:sigma-54-specific transcriptional regulator